MVLQASINISSAIIKNVSPSCLHNLSAVLWVDPKYKQKRKITSTRFLNTYRCENTIYIPLRASLDDSTLYIDVIHASGTFATSENDGDSVIGSVLLPLRDVGIGLIPKTKSMEIYSSSGHPRGKMVLEVVVHDYTSYRLFPCHSASTTPYVIVSGKKSLVLPPPVAPKEYPPYQGASNTPSVMPSEKKISSGTGTTTISSRDYPPQHGAYSTTPSVMPSEKVPPQEAFRDYPLYQDAYTIPNGMPSVVVPPPVASRDYPPSAPPAPYEHSRAVDAPPVAGYPCYQPRLNGQIPFYQQPVYEQVNWTKTIFAVGVGVGILCGVALGMGFGYVQETVRHVLEWYGCMKELLKQVLGLILAFFLAREIDRRFF